MTELLLFCNGRSWRFTDLGFVPDGSVEVCGGHSSAATVYERIRLEKLPYVHRAVGITSDSKGSNFGVLQSDPKTR